MKGFLLLLSVLALLTGCNFNGDELTFLNVKLEKVKGEVKEFINQMETNENGFGNGIYIFNDSEGRYYLYLSQEFLDDGKSFGEVDVNIEDDSLNIYLNESSANENAGNTYKLYEINVANPYKVLRVYKNGEETNIQTIGA